MLINEHNNCTACNWLLRSFGWTKVSDCCRVSLLYEHRRSPKASLVCMQSTYWQARYVVRWVFISPSKSEISQLEIAIHYPAFLNNPDKVSYLGIPTRALVADKFTQCAEMVSQRIVIQRCQDVPLACYRILQQLPVVWIQVALQALRLCALSCRPSQHSF